MPVTITTSSNYKSIPAGLRFELPDFSIITGKNGSGKSHLLEAMANQAVARVWQGPDVLSNVQLIGFGALNPQIAEGCQANYGVQQHRQWWNQIEPLQRHLKEARSRAGDPIDLHGLWSESDARHLFGVVARLQRRCDKDFIELVEQDFIDFAEPVVREGGGLFLSQLAIIFKVYQERFLNNRFNDFQNKECGEVLPVLTDEQFKRLHGPAPWDLVNEIFRQAGLKYRVNSPLLYKRDADFRLTLSAGTAEEVISVNDLSTGEKVLLCLAIAVYNAGEGGGKPEMLLLDEPDAPLHPEFSRTLIDVLENTIVKMAQVKVVLTTHSPTTVAMCPEGAVFEMNAGKRVPMPVSTRHAVAILTKDIPSLRVSIESRRQVFVEGKNDVKYYEQLFGLVSRHAKFDFDLLFLEPNSSKTSNCADVLKIANTLAACGNDLVRGIVDWDGCSKDQGVVVVLGQGRRYAIDNYILDPLFVALALVKASQARFSDFDVPELVAYIDGSGLTNAQAQRIVNTVLAALGLDNGEEASVQLLNGYILKYPVSFLNHHGHKYEQLLVARFPKLNSISRGNGEGSLKLGVLSVLEDFSKFLPVDLLETFNRLQEDIVAERA